MTGSDHCLAPQSDPHFVGVPIRTQIPRTHPWGLRLAVEGLRGRHGRIRRRVVSSVYNRLYEETSSVSTSKQLRRRGPGNRPSTSVPSPDVSLGYNYTKGPWVTSWVRASESGRRDRTPPTMTTRPGPDRVLLYSGQRTRRPLLTWCGGSCLPRATLPPGFLPTVKTQEGKSPVPGRIESGTYSLCNRKGTLHQGLRPR